MAPSEWPDWVLVFPHGTCPGEPARQADLHREFHDWRHRRAAWALTHTALTAPAFSQAAMRERRRRRSTEETTIPRAERKARP